jgi:hypothetical protein
MESPTPPPPPEPSPAAKKYVFSDYLFQFITITAGVLIALLINGLVEWNGNRTLVREARVTISKEIAANKAEVDIVIADRPARAGHLDEALALVDRLLAADKPKSASLNLGFNMADLSTAGWDSAARTGALAHMDYAEVQRYSRLYSHQELFATYQDQAMANLTAALAIFAAGADPLSNKPADLERFRDRVLMLRAGLIVEEQVAARLVKEYTEMLGR